MILFKDSKEIEAFLELNLPTKIKNELFYNVTYREYKGKKIEDRQRLKPFFIFDKLRIMEFAIGITSNPNDIFFPEKYVLLWSRLLKFLKVTDSLSNEQQKYALISINKACQFLDITRPTLYKIINEKKIPYIQILSQKRIQLKDLLDYIDNNKKYK